MNSPETVSSVYVRRLYDDVLGWYRNADAKAQVVLTIDAVFVAFLANAIFKNSQDLSATVAALPIPARICLGLMLLTLTGSMASAVVSLRSRIYSTDKLTATIRKAQSKYAHEDRLAPEVAWFFQFVAAAKPDELRQTLATVDAEFELGALASQIHILAGNVRAKHLATNWGFALATATLVLFLAAAAFHVGSAP
jgi:hypothetical protein